MKTIIWIVVVAGIFALLITLSIFYGDWSKTEYVILNVAEAKESSEPLSYQQRAWLGALMWCESRGDPKAVNPKDKDNTPSYGILQFKPDTFYYYGKRYGIKTKAGYKDPETQIKIVEQMIIRGDVKWAQQFPDCTKKLGPPPKLSTLSVDKK